MALIHLDFPSGSPGIYGTSDTKLLDGVYAEIDSGTSTGLADDPDPNITGITFRLRNGAGWNPIIRFVLPSAQTVVGMGRRVYLPELPNSTGSVQTVAEWRNGANATIAKVVVDTTGRLVLTCGAATTTSSIPWIVANTWQHIESYLDTSGGELRVRVEGIDAASLTGLTVSNGPTAQVLLAKGSGTVGNPTGGWAQYMKDVTVWDGTGSYNNSWLGPIQVFDLTPNGDVSNGWTSTGADAYSVIDESTPNDADYISAGASPLPSPAVVSTTDLPSNIVGVRGLMTFTRAWKTDGGDATLVPGLSPDGTNWDNGSDVPVSTAASYWRRISEVSPATSLPWTPLEVNDLQLRFNRTV